LIIRSNKNPKGRSLKPKKQENKSELGSGNAVSSPTLATESFCDRKRYEVQQMRRPR